MSYEEFIREMMEIIGRSAGEGLSLSVHRAVKNNGCRREGILFREEGRSVCPTIYLEEFYEQYRNGREADMVAAAILAVYREVRVEQGQKGEELKDYSLVKERIIYRLVSRSRNEQLLPHTPYAEYLDLAILFYVLADLEGRGNGISTMLIRNEHLNWWGVTAEDICRRAHQNTRRLLISEFRPMCAVIDEMLDLFEEEEEVWKERCRQESMYVLTNHIRNCGAAALLYPGQLEEAGRFFGESYYILPSSIHEVILIPESKALSREEMEWVVREVNETQVHEEEYLSDRVYYYDREAEKIIL